MQLSSAVASADAMGIDVSGSPLPQSTIPGAVLLYQLARLQRQGGCPLFLFALPSLHHPLVFTHT